MKERPIIFSEAMVQAILGGRKTQTRRIVKMSNAGGGKLVPYTTAFRTSDGGWGFTDGEPWPQMVEAQGKKCPYGVPGDRLWVRETWGADNWEYIKQYKAEPWMGEPDPGTAEIYYLASEKSPDIFPKGYWKPSIHMPRWASRLTLEITDVRVQRLQEITEDDAKAEGMPGVCRDGGWQCPIEQFFTIWNSIHGQEAWNENPWVWAISFRHLKG